MERIAAGATAHVEDSAGRRRQVFGQHAAGDGELHPVALQPLPLALGEAVVMKLDRIAANRTG